MVMRRGPVTERPHGEGAVEVTRVVGGRHPPEENVELLGCTPERTHLLLQIVYGDFPHHNYGLHLDGGIADNAACQNRWRRLAAQSASWYATSSGAVGRQFYGYLGRRMAGDSHKKLKL